MTKGLIVIICGTALLIAAAVLVALRERRREVQLPVVPVALASTGDMWKIGADENLRRQIRVSVCARNPPTLRNPFAFADCREGLLVPSATRRDLMN